MILVLIRDDNIIYIYIVCHTLFQKNDISRISHTTSRLQEFVRWAKTNHSQQKVLLYAMLSRVTVRVGLRVQFLPLLSR
jgi:hypothetical protein